MRVAFLTAEFVTEANGLAGAANFLARTVLAVRELGHEPEVFTWSAQDGTTEWRGIPVHRVSWARSLPHRILNKVMLGSLDHPLLVGQMAVRLRNRLRQVHRATPFDVVHASGSGCTAFSAPTLNIPSVTRLSGYQPDIDRLSGQKATLQRRFSCWLEAMAAKTSVRRYAPSKLVVGRYSEHYDLELDVQEPCFTLDVAQEAFAPLPERLNGVDYILYFGPLSYLKGVDVLAKSLRKVLEKRPEVKAVFVGPDRGIGGKSSCDYIRQELGGELAGRCLFFGKLPHEQLYPIVKNARVVAIPSRLDNIPNTCLEAMAFGKIVVGTRDASLEQLISHGESGFLVPQEDSAALADAIISALTLPDEESARISAAAKARIRELRPEKAGARLVDYLQESITEHRRA